MKESQENQLTAGQGLPAPVCSRFVRWLRTRRNVAQWWWREIGRYRRSHWVLRWMTKRFGAADCMMGERSWRINGVLCTIWLGPLRLKVYHDGGKATKCFELTDADDAARAKEHVLRLSENTEGLASTADNATPKP